MLFYFTFVFIVVASSVLADHHPGLKRSEKPPIPVAGTTLLASVTTVVTQFQVPEIANHSQLETTSSAAIGVMIDGFDGCVGAFSGVQIIVDGGKAYYNAVYQKTTDTNYETYTGITLNPGDLVTTVLVVNDETHRVNASFAINSNNLNQTQTSLFDLGEQICLSDASWIVAQIPDLPLTKIGTVVLPLSAAVEQIPLRVSDSQAFSNNGTTVSVSSDHVYITVE